jgi:putative flippase GtrA
MLKIRYITLGLLNFMISFFIFLGLLKLLSGELNYPEILTISFIFAIPIIHLSQRKFVWRSTNNYLLELQKFFMVNLPPFLFNLALLPILIEVWDLPIIQTQFITGGLIVLGTFVVHKTWTFK